VIGTAIMVAKIATGENQTPNRSLLNERSEAKPGARLMLNGSLPRSGKRLRKGGKNAIAQK
jgi:hypothetical protein